MAVNFLDLVNYGSAPAGGDVLAIVKIADDTQDPRGSTLRIAVSDLFTTPSFTTGITVSGFATVSGLGTFGSLTVSGAITGTTSTFSGAMALTGAARQITLGGVTANGSAVFNNDNASQSWLVGTSGALHSLDFILLADLTTGPTNLLTVNASTKVLTSAFGFAGNLTGTLAGTVVGSLTGNVTGNVTGNLSGTTVAVTGGLTTSGPTGTGLGYATGAGGTVTQTGTRTSAVTINKLCGVITTDTTSLTSTFATFTVNNSTVAATDDVRVSLASGSSAAAGATQVYVSGIAAGSFKITVNAVGVTETGALAINFTVLKSVSS